MKISEFFTIRGGLQIVVGMLLSIVLGSMQDLLNITVIPRLIAYTQGNAIIVVYLVELESHP
jgi:hypothetical protein